MSVSLEQPMREAEIDLIELANANEAAIAQEAQDRISADTTLTNNLSGIQSQLSFLASVPELEFGTSNSFSVQGSSYTDVDVTFTTKTEEPIVLCGLQHATGNLNCIVTAVTNQQFSARVYNLTTTDVSDVTLDWLTISGR